MTFEFQPYLLQPANHHLSPNRLKIASGLIRQNYKSVAPIMAQKTDEIITSSLDDFEKTAKNLETSPKENPEKSLETRQTLLSIAENIVLESSKHLTEMPTHAYSPYSESYGSRLEAIDKATGFFSSAATIIKESAEVGRGDSPVPSLASIHTQNTRFAVEAKRAHATADIFDEGLNKRINESADSMSTAIGKLSPGAIDDDEKALFDDAIKTMHTIATMLMKNHDTVAVYTALENLKLKFIGKEVEMRHSTSLERSKLDLGGEGEGTEKENLLSAHFHLHREAANVIQSSWDIRDFNSAVIDHGGAYLSGSPISRFGEIVGSFQKFTYKVSRHAKNKNVADIENEESEE